MITKTPVRVFEFGKHLLADPNPKMKPEEVVTFYSNKYPELTTAVVSKPTLKDDKLVYEIKTNLGTKG